jgi:hypothetical protein
MLAIIVHPSTIPETEMDRWHYVYPALCFAVKDIGITVKI